MVLESRLASLHELQSVYGIEDLYNFIELITVQNYNEALIQNFYSSETN